MSLSLPRPRLGDDVTLSSFLSRPLLFDEPVHKGDWATSVGTREVEAGPSSPPRRSSQFNGNDDTASTTNGPTISSSRLVTPSKTSPPARTSTPSTPDSDRKGKVKTAITPPYPEEIDFSWPTPYSNIRKPAAGLFNPYMACYANATLQILMHTPPVLRIAREHDPSKCVLSSGVSKRFCMLCILRQSVALHWSGQSRVDRPAVHSVLSDIKKGFSKNKQEDTHEFFRFVTDALQNSALASLPTMKIPERLRRTTWVHRVWGGVMRSRVICFGCKNKSDTYDSFLDLSVDVHPSKRTLEAILQGFVKEDRLDGDNKYSCEKCKTKAIANKSFKIDRVPPILTFHLKRFSMKYDTYNGKPRADKYNHHIAFPEWLDMAPFMVDPTGQDTKYRVFGATCHAGVELRSGHYTSYVRAPNGQWYLANDEDMEQVSIKQVLNDRTAYLLSYIRVADSEFFAGIRTSTSTYGPEIKQAPPLQYQTTVPSNGVHGHTSAINGYGPSVIPKGHNSPTKRKREDAATSGDTSRQTPSPSLSIPGFKGTPGPGPGPRHYEPPTPTQWGYNPRKARDDPSSRKPSWPIEHDTHKSKKQRKKDRRNERNEDRQQQRAPMPYQHGRTQNGGRGGFSGAARGSWKNMKGKQEGQRGGRK